MHKVLTFTVGIAATLANYALAFMIFLVYYQLFGNRRAEAANPFVVNSIIAALLLSPALLWIGRWAHRRGHSALSYVPLGLVAAPGLYVLVEAGLKKLQGGP